MIVEVTGAAFENKGAQLMLVAVREQVGQWESVDGLALNFRVGSRAQRGSVGYRSILHLESDRRPWANTAVSQSARWTPQQILGSAGFVRRSQVGAVLDASGFYFSDQWGVPPITLKIRQYQGWRESGIPIVLLPQAFGPFESPGIRDAARTALEHADLIFARDDESLGHVESLNLQAPRVLSAPDFTNLVEPPPHLSREGTVAIIPNSRMIDMTSGDARRGYRSFLRTVARSVVDAGHPLVVVVHELQDADLAASLKADMDQPVEVIQLADPTEIKAVLGGVSLVVSSRYHGLVSAMSQGVPAIGTSWSHKYAALFSDYGCPDALWDVRDEPGAADRMAVWLAPRALVARSRALKQRSLYLKSRVRSMWDEVHAHLIPLGD